jgi:hypothetical protein
MVAGNPLARAEPAARAYPAAVHAGATQKALRPGWKGRPTRSSHREPGRAAEETGREWGAYLTEPSLCVARLTARDEPGERQPAADETR